MRPHGHIHGHRHGGFQRPFWGPRFFGPFGGLGCLFGLLPLIFLILMLTRPLLGR